MRRFVLRVSRLLFWALLLAAVAWAIAATRQLQQMRQARTADDEATRDLSESELQVARRFLATQEDSRRRFVSLAEEARRRGNENADVTKVRAALAGGLLAAAQGDSSAVRASLARAERALDDSLSGSAAGGVRSGSGTVAARAHALEAAMNLGRDLLTESHGPAERLVARASRLFQDGEHDQAALLLDLAGQLLGVPIAGAAEEEAPEWFLSMAAGPLPDVSAAEAKKLTDFCEAVAQSQAPSSPVRLMVERARRHYESGEHSLARWWASVALECLGMSEESAAAGGAAAEPEP